MEIEDFGLHDNPVDWPVIHVKTTADGSAVHGRQDLLLGRKRSRDGGADGIFAEWHWNGETLAAANDRFGFFPLYYFASNSEIAVSPSVEKLIVARSEEHTSELQSLMRISYAVFCLKKKKKPK